MAQTGNHKGLTFGIFLAPFHRVGENPTLGMARDMELIEWIDELGYDEAWIGEHHFNLLGVNASPLAMLARRNCAGGKAALLCCIVSCPAAGFSPRSKPGCCRYPGRTGTPARRARD